MKLYNECSGLIIWFYLHGYMECILSADWAFYIKISNDEKLMRSKVHMFVFMSKENVIAHLFQTKIITTQLFPLGYILS